LPLDTSITLSVNAELVECIDKGRSYEAIISLSCLVLSCLVLSCLVLSCLVLSCLVLSCLVLSCMIVCN